MSQPGATNVVPADFAQLIEAREGEAGEVWVAELPDLVDEFALRWSLRVDGDTRFGYVGIVVPVLRAEGTGAVLKVSYPDGESRGEASSLVAWTGNGAGQLLDRVTSGFVMLLERLDPDRSLFSRPVPEGVAVIGGLLSRLHQATAPADWHRFCGAYDARLLDAAMATWRELGPASGDRLLHRDLHYGNVLAGQREPWLAIDPEGMAGDPAYDVIPAVWNQLDQLISADDPAAAVRWRIDGLCEAAGIDRARAYRWTLARAIEDLVWQLRTGSSGPGGEVLIAEALLSRC